MMGINVTTRRREFSAAVQLLVMLCMCVSTCAADSWNAANSGLNTRRVDSLAIDPTNPQTIYAGTAYEGGVFKSINGGDSWSAVNSGLTSKRVISITIDPITPQTIYAGTIDGGVLFKSVNGGGPSDLTLTATVTGGNGTISCPPTVAYNAPAICTISPATGYYLATLADNGKDVYTSVSGNSYAIDHVTANHEIATTFTTEERIDGACGTANATATEAISETSPATNLCIAGTASAITGTGPWNWNCSGSVSGTTAYCSANYTTTAEPPAKITVPSIDEDGSYVVKWTQSITPATGITYTLQELLAGLSARPITIGSRPSRAVCRGALGSLGQTDAWS